MWSLDLSLRRIRDCSALASILNRCDSAERRWLGRQLANLLATLPAAQGELAAQSTRVYLPEMQELVRQVGMLETVILELAREGELGPLGPDSAAHRLEPKGGDRLLKAPKG